MSEVTPEIQALIDAAVEGLQAKNKELLGELKKAKRGGDVDPAELQRLESQVDQLEAEKRELSKQVKDLSKNFETTKQALDSESKFTQRLLIENGLTAELSKAGVTNAAHLKAAQAMLRESVQIVADGDVRVAKIGDKGLADFVKEWAAGDEGKHFVQAPANSGGGATGGNGGGAANGKGKVDGTPEERAAYFAAKYPDLTTP